MAHSRRGWWRSIARVVVATAAVSALAGTGYGWRQLDRLDAGLSRAPVIDPGPRPGSAGAGDQNIMLVGLDSRVDAQGERLPPELLAQLHAGRSTDGGDVADTVIVLHVPAGGSGAVAFSIPRDSYVELSGGYGKHKINSAYAYGRKAALVRLGVTGPEAASEVAAARDGARTLIGTVESLTGLPITHYMALNLVGFYRLSMAVGGVPVCLRNPVHDGFTGLDLPAGPSVIEGAQALAFVRQRHGLPEGDLSRIRRQQVFLASLAHQVLAQGVLSDPARTGDLTAALGTSVTVDEDLDPIALAGQLRHLTSGELRFLTIPVLDTALSTSDGDAVQVDPGQVRRFVADQVAGRSSTPDTLSTATGPVATPATGEASEPGSATAVTAPAAGSDGADTDGTDGTGGAAGAACVD